MQPGFGLAEAMHQRAKVFAAGSDGKQFLQCKMKHPKARSPKAQAGQKEMLLSIESRGEESASQSMRRAPQGGIGYFQIGPCPGDRFGYQSSKEPPCGQRCTRDTKPLLKTAEKATKRRASGAALG